MKQQAVVVSIAGFYFQVVFQKPLSDSPEKRQLREAVVANLADFRVKTVPAYLDGTIILLEEPSYQLQFTRENNAYIPLTRYVSQREIVTFYHISLFQFYVVLSFFLTDLLAEHNGLSFHASSALVNNKVAIFAGTTGAGKSTIGKMLAKRFNTLSDDHATVRKTNGEYCFYQTPYIEKVLVKKTSRSYQLGPICFLKQGKTTSVTHLSAEEGIKRISTNIPLPQQHTKKVLQTAVDIAKQCKLYELTFTTYADELISYISSHHAFQ
jgi:hypothetical protein